MYKRVVLIRQTSELTPKLTGVGGIRLPEPSYWSDVSVEEAPSKSRSIRDYMGEGLTLQEVSQLLWAVKGITDPRGFRTAPSAGALYPLEIYVVVGEVENLAKSVYSYNPHEHELVKVVEGDKRLTWLKPP